MTCDELKNAGYTFGDIVTLAFLGQSLSIPFCNNFSDVDSGCPALFARDTDTNAVLAVNMGDFATTYGIAVKTTREDESFVWNYTEGVEGPVTFTISLGEAGGYYSEYLMHQLSYTDDRADYPNLSDEQFANFRAVTTTGMGKNVLFRTASPVNPKRSRNTYADAAIRAAGVSVVMNLSENESTVRDFAGYDTSYYATVRSVALNMGVDFTSADFQTKLARGLRYLAENPGVYAVHCVEGKDRTGFVVALLECLMGAGYDEVIADYMITYYNYYGVTETDERYDVIANSNIVRSLQNAFGTENLETADLADEAERYIRSIGLTDSELAALRANLSATPEPAAEEPEPAAEAASSESEAAGNTVYVVAAGDCLWGLATRFYGAGRQFVRIAEANGIRSPYTIYIGQTLIIPAR